MALLTQADIEKTLQISFGTNPDPVVDFLIEGTQAIIEQYCNRVFEEQVGKIDTIDGGSKQVHLSMPPVTAVASIVEDGTTLQASNYAWYPNGKIVRVSSGYDINWTNKRQSIVVTYTGGFNVVPFDVRAAAAAVAGEAFKMGAAYAAQRTPGVNLERIGDYMVQFDLEQAMANLTIPPGVRRVLNNRKLVAVA